MNVNCPHCQVHLSIHPSQAGSVVACPICAGKFQIPIPTASSTYRQPHSEHFVPSEVKAFASKKIAAGICGIMLGTLGVHKFVLGLNSSGAIMLAVSIFGACLYLPILAMMTIGMIEGIIYLSKSDEDFYQTYAVQKKEWF
ncbi:MAG TPA: hypothetical protein DDZ51_10865 [Planctomycetaceae bacterium]|nr:hypothetical protein [Planctomycetaceae bacterium]